MYSIFILLESPTNVRRLSIDRLQSLQTLAYSDNIDLQKSAALCFSEISETCKYMYIIKG